MGTRRNRRNRPFVEDLRRTDLFRGCTTKELRLIASFVTPISCRRGRVLIRQGAGGHECFVVAHGHAVVERDGVIIGHAVEGSVIGELALLDNFSRTATVTAATDMDVLVMSRAELASIRALGIRSVDEALARAAAEHRDALQSTVAPPEVAEPVSV